MIILHLFRLMVCMDERSDDVFFVVKGFMETRILLFPLPSFDSFHLPLLLLSNAVSRQETNVLFIFDGLIHVWICFVRPGFPSHLLFSFFLFVVVQLSRDHSSFHLAEHG